MSKAKEELFEVTMTRDVTESATVMVRATSAAAANEKALDLAGSDEGKAIRFTGDEGNAPARAYIGDPDATTTVEIDIKPVGGAKLRRGSLVALLVPATLRSTQGTAIDFEHGQEFHYVRPGTAGDHLLESGPHEPLVRVQDGLFKAVFGVYPKSHWLSVSMAKNIKG